MGGHGGMAWSQTPFQGQGVQDDGTDDGGCALVQLHTLGEFGGCACEPVHLGKVPRTAVGMDHERKVWAVVYHYDLGMNLQESLDCLAGCGGS